MIRYLNFYHLSRDRIHYFSIRVKEELVKDLAKIYEISEGEHVVSFRSTLSLLPDFRYRMSDGQWYMGDQAVTLPRSRKDCSRQLHIVHRTTVLTF